MTNYTRILLSCIFLATHAHLHAGDIVSQSSLDGTTTPTIVDKWVPALNGQNTQGFVQIRDGIFLNSANTNGIDINGRVDGVISLGGGSGTLSLIRDLTFGGTSFAITSGRITTTNNGQKLILTQNQIIPLGVSLTTSGNLTISSNQNSIDLDTSTTLRVRAGNKLTLQNTSLLRVSSTKLVMENTLSKLVLDSGDIVLNGDYTFSQGSLRIQGACSLQTTASIDTLFTFSGHHLFIAKNSSLTIGPNVTFQYNPGSGIREGIFLEDMSSQLILNNATLRNNNAIGMILHNGSLIINGTSTVEGTNTSTKQALILGGSADLWGDCRLLINPEAKLTVKRSGIVYRNKGVNGLSTSGNQGLIHVDINGLFTIEEALTPLESLAITSTSQSAVSFIGTTNINLNSKRLNFGLIKINSSTGVDSITSGGTTALISFSNQNGTSPEYAHFSPNGRYLAIAMGSATAVSYPSSKLQVYSLLDTGSFASIVSRLAQDVPNSTEGTATNRVFVLMFSPDGKFLATSEESQLNIYSFDTNNGPPSQDLNPISSVATGGFIMAAVWSPDGRFLAVCNSASLLIVYGWDGAQLTQLDSQSISVSLRGLAWSKNGQYLLAGDTVNNSLLRLFRFDDEKKLTQITSRSIAGSTLAADLEISPDGHYVLLAHEQSDAGNSASIFSFFNGELSNAPIAGASGGFGLSTKWNPEGKFFLVGVATGFDLFSFNGTSATILLSTVLPNQVSALDWHPTGSYLAITHYSDAGASGEVQTRAVPYSPSTRELALTNGTMTTNQSTIFNDINLRIK